MVDISNPLFSETDASNNANSPNGYNSSTTPANVIAIEQAFRGAVKRLYDRMGPTVTTTGSSNAYIYTPVNTSYPTSLIQGDIYCAIANFSNTGATTLAVNGLTATAIKKNSSSGLVALSGTEIQSGAAFVVLYDGTFFELLNPIPAAVAGYLPLTGGALTGAINLAQASNLASASTTNIGAAEGNYINITGTTTITAFDTVQAGAERVLNFNGALTLTYNATSLILPGKANIITAAGDTAIMMSLGSGNWVCIDYQRVGLFSPITSSLGGIVALNNISSYFDGPTISQGTTGTWFVSGNVTMLDTTTLGTFNAKLWDGATVIASGSATSSAMNNQVCISLSGYLVSPAGNLRISVQETTGTSGEILSNQTGAAKDSTITAIRIA